MSSMPRATTPVQAVRDIGMRCTSRAHRGCSRGSASSAKVLRRAYLRIDGAWADHVLTSLINPVDCPPR
jgi:hypothetical protein